MPIPSPHTDESKDAFISRCMEALADDYTDNDQRAAICYKAWNEKRAAAPTRIRLRSAVLPDQDDDRAVTVTCSTETLGRDDVVLVSGGIDLTFYRLNPIFLWQHNPEWPVARAEHIDLAGDKLVAR